LLQFPLILLLAMSLATSRESAGQAAPINPASPLPDAPLPVIRHDKSGPCRIIPRTESYGSAVTATGSASAAKLAGVPPVHPAPAQPTSAQAELPHCPSPPLVNFFARFINGPEVKPLTPKEKARLAVKNLLDPFNAVTILGTAAVSVGFDSHSPYGPGMPGFGRYVGVEYTQDMTGEFFNTFLIPSIVHQDPHYHRMPDATIRRRIFHAVYQVIWTQGDNGKGMLNYSNLIGNAIDDEIGNLYIPGRETNLPASAERYATGLAIAPTDNFVTEFLPDVASHIHVRIVLIQRIINTVAKTDNNGTP
jgi:hypothetical protein